MPTKKNSFDTVRELGLALPGVEEGTTYGTPALKVGGKMFACVPSHRSAEPGSLAVRIDFAQRDELLAAEPRTYYLKEHYVNYPCVLVRLAHIRRDALTDLLLMAWRFVSTGTKKRITTRRPVRPSDDPTRRGRRRSPGDRR